MKEEATFDGLSDSDALNVIGLLVDEASDTGNLVLVDRALALCDELQDRDLEEDSKSLLDYFRANAWACRYRRRYHEGQSIWEFEQPEIQEQVFLLRRAQHSPGFALLAPIRRCQLLTNLGNQFDALGRFVDAHASWTAALRIDPHFWMARANRGRGLMFYAAALYDPGHQAFFAARAYDELTEALTHIELFPHLGDANLSRRFRPAAEQIAQRYDLEAIRKSYRPKRWSLGESVEEQSYRRWCLDRVLFLNPLNDVDAGPISAQDVLSLPDFSLPLHEPPVIPGMFNELKQQFVAARWLLWEGTRAEGVHFSDRGVLLTNTLDYPSHGLSVEKVKVAFRQSYALFDKIAYFLNYYLGLGVAERDVSFRTIWRNRSRGPLRDRIGSSENWPLRGLYWLSKDLFEKGLKDTIEPDARALAELRNHLEHKYVKVLEMAIGSTSHDPFHDPLAYRITRSDLVGKTIRLLQLTRSALIYLSLSIHREEQRREQEEVGGLSVPLPLDAWRDEWKQ